LRVQLDAADFDPVGARIQLERLLGALDWSVPWLSPSAVLCIKQLPDPRPKTLRLRSGDLRPSVVWQRALLAVVEDKVRRAVRPAFGAVAPDAEAVVFADRAELIACLLLDWCDGRVTSQWWWRALFGSGALDRAAIAALIQGPEYLPPVLERLVQARRTSRFRALVSAEDVERLLHALLVRFGLERLGATSAPERPVSASVSQAAAPNQPAPREPGGSERVRLPPSTILPWGSWIAEHELAGLDSGLLLLFGIALSLRRAPTVVRSAGFARALSEYHAATQMLTPLRASTPDRSATRVLSGVGSVAEHAGDTVRVPSGRSEPRRETVFSEPAAQEAASHEHEDCAPPLGSRPAFIADECALPFQGSTESAPVYHSPLSTALEHDSERTRETGTAVGSDTPPIAGVVPLPTMPSGSLLSEEAARLTRVYGAALNTKLGGLFYLVNLALALGFYPDFTRPRDEGLSLSIWDFVALTGRRLLDGPAEDPVWELLRRLAGSSDSTHTGARFEPSTDWRVPCAWLSAFADAATVQVHVAAGRLRIEHAAGFALLDVASHGDPRIRLETELVRYPGLTLARPVDTEPCAPERTTASPVERWLDWLMPYVRARLSRALGLARPQDLSSVLLTHSAWVHVSETHIDVRFALAELPIVVRSAGLDRDPGWLPAAGRFLSFHFE
jgi:hypothetical protein